MLADIVILPPVEVRSRIGTRLKKEISTFPHIFIVDNDKLIPHLSLWHLKISEARVDILARRLQKATRGQKPITITSTGFHNDKDCLSFSVKNSNALKNLQKEVFLASYPLRTGMMSQFAAVFGRWTGEKLEEAKKYGRPLGFAPHVTAGWMKEEKDANEISRKMEGVRFAFKAKEMYVCEVDEWWQVKRIIRKIVFK